MIIGGSAAGISAARAIADQGFGASVLLISDEDRLPYKRTKVSKSFASGFDRDAFALEPATWWERHGVQLLLGRRVAALDPGARALELADGQRVAWERLILATGAEPNRPPLAAGVQKRMHFAHDIRQVEALRAAARQARSALVVGLGVLGAEVAEQLTLMGKQVTFTGDTAAVMQQELNPTAARMLARALTQNGVELLPSQIVDQVQPAGQGLELTLGSAGQRRFDLVVFCIGLRPRTALAAAAGLRVEQGVVVDQQLRTSHPDIFAAGDVAQHPDGQLTHLWRHALHQGRVAGLNALGAAEPYRFEPFRLKCKVFGHYFFSLGRPDPAELHRFEVHEHRAGDLYRCCYYQQGQLTGLVMCNDEPNQKRYNQAVVQGWNRQRFETVFSRQIL